MLQEERTVSRLIMPKCVVYIVLRDKETRRQFMEDAEREGFRFGDGVRPTEREAGDLMRIYPDKSLCYVGYVGHMCYGKMISVEDGKKRRVVRVDYRRYKAGEPAYIVGRRAKDGRTYKRPQKGFSHAEGKRGDPRV